MSKKHVITYGDAVQVRPDVYRFVKAIKVITEQTNVYDILEWLRGLGVKNPDLTMIDIISLDDSDD